MVIIIIIRIKYYHYYWCYYVFIVYVVTLVCFVCTLCMIKMLCCADDVCTGSAGSSRCPRRSSNNMNSFQTKKKHVFERAPQMLSSSGAGGLVTVHNSHVASRKAEGSFRRVPRIRHAL